MGEQKNLFLAIGLSIAIIIIFQLIFPQQALMTNVDKSDVDQNQQTTSIDENQTNTSSNPIEYLRRYNYPNN